MDPTDKSLLVLVFGLDAPSTRYRWLEYESHFKAAGWNVKFARLEDVSDFAMLADFDVVVLQKTMVSGRVFKQIRRHAKKLVYDADDRIWMRPGKPYRGLTRWKIQRRMRAIASGADICIAANSYIADDLTYFSAEPVVIPMALDTGEWKYREPDPVRPTIGWTGGPKNLPFLKSILPALRSVLGKHDISFQIHCGENPQFSGINYQYIPFELGQESEAVRGFDIGLCPLPDDPFSSGKSPIKSLQYLASGAAVVASPHGAVQDILIGEKSGLWAVSLEEWESQISRLVEDTSLRLALARQGRARLEERFATPKVFDELRVVMQ